MVSDFIKLKMKLLLKILFFIFTMTIITVGEAKSSTVATILQEETSYSFIQKPQLGAILFENHNVNFCLNEWNVVAYSERGINAERSVAKGGRFTQQQIDNYVTLATKNPEAKKVMFGMWEDGAPTSYVNKAGKEYTYFDMGDEWNKAEALVNKSRDEMWRINKQFIDEQYRTTPKKEFWFSHDPFSPTINQYFSDEVLYLIDLGMKDFEKVGDLWRAVW